MVWQPDEVQSVVEVFQSELRFMKPVTAGKLEVAVSAYQSN